MGTARKASEDTQRRHDSSKAPYVCDRRFIEASMIENMNTADSIAAIPRTLFVTLPSISIAILCGRQPRTQRTRFAPTSATRIFYAGLHRLTRGRAFPGARLVVESGQKQPIGFFLDDGITLTRKLLEHWPVEDGDLAAGVLDDA